MGIETLTFLSHLDPMDPRCLSLWPANGSRLLDVYSWPFLSSTRSMSLKRMNCLKPQFAPSWALHTSATTRASKETHGSKEQLWFQKSSLTHINQSTYKISKDSHHGFLDLLRKQTLKIGSDTSGLQSLDGTLGCRTLPAPPQSYLSWQHLGFRLDFCCWHPCTMDQHPVEVWVPCHWIFRAAHSSDNNVASCKVWSPWILTPTLVISNRSTWIKPVPFDYGYGDQHLYQIL